MKITLKTIKNNTWKEVLVLPLTNGLDPTRHDFSYYIKFIFAKILWLSIYKKIKSELLFLCISVFDFFLNALLLI